MTHKIHEVSDFRNSQFFRKNDKTHLQNAKTLHKL